MLEKQKSISTTRIEIAFLTLHMSHGFAVSTRGLQYLVIDNICSPNGLTLHVPHGPVFRLYLHVSNRYCALTHWNFIQGDMIDYILVAL